MQKIDIQQLKKDLEDFQSMEQKKSKIDSVIKHIGAVGRNREVGKWQNSFDCKVQATLQYSEGGQCYWSDPVLDKEFMKTIHENFNQLLEKTTYRVNLEYQQSKSIFDKYGVKDEQEKA